MKVVTLNLALGLAALSRAAFAAPEAPGTDPSPVPAPEAASAPAPTDPAAPASELPAASQPAEAQPAPPVTKAAPTPAPVAAPAAPAEHFPLPAPADAPPPKSSEPILSRFNVGVNADVLWYTDRSYDLFSENDVSTNQGISLGYAVLMDGPLSIVPELGFGGDAQSSSNLFGGALQSAKLRTWRFYGGASVRYAVLSFLEPHVRLVGGTSVLAATITPATGAPVLEDKGLLSPFLSVGGGFTLKTPNGALETASGHLRSLVLGLTFEGGYVIAKSVELAPAPETAIGRIPTTDAALGTLARSSPYLRISGVVRF